MGKTTLLRDFAHALANDLGLGTSVVVVDTSNEIAGAEGVCVYVRGWGKMRMEGCLKFAVLQMFQCQLQDS